MTFVDGAGITETARRRRMAFTTHHKDQRFSRRLRVYCCAEAKRNFVSISYTLLVLTCQINQQTYPLNSTRSQLRGVYRVMMFALFMYS